MSQRYDCRRGITLLEMSIVIVIIGLVIGSLMIGKDLFITARDRSIIKEAKFYQDAVHAFYLKYQQLPGDMVDPQNYWAAEPWSGNGNGNGSIVWSWEGPEAWRMLELAGFLKSSNIDISCTTNCIASPGDNIPRSSTISNAGWTIAVNNQSGTNILIFGAFDGASIATKPVISGKEAWYVDGKMDDGNPSGGNVRARNSWGYTNCVLAADPTQYSLTTNDPNCQFDVALGL